QVAAGRVAHGADAVRVDLERGALAAQELHGGLDVVDVLGIHRLARAGEPGGGGERPAAPLGAARAPVQIVRAGAHLPGAAVDEQQGRVCAGRGRRVQIAEQRRAVVVGVFDPELDLDVWS